MRVMLFTDTLGDVNGVSRFVDNMSRAALVSEKPFRDQPLVVVTSTRFEVPRRANILNVRPALSMPMPGYPQLQLALPPVLALRRAFREFKPDVVHVSTPGLVGLVGLALARSAEIPVVGVYHTDFPAYVDHLFENDSLTSLTSFLMSVVYRRFARVVTRSDDYAKRLVTLGLDLARLSTLRPGLDLEMFHPRFRAPSVWSALGIDPFTPKVLYVGRVSVEKNLSFLVEVWKSLGVNASLVVVGDGPYRATMERELAGTNTIFLGFRHGAELSTLYASSDIFVFPSTTDTLGQVVLEAQASGLPVLVSDRGGPCGVVRDGATGLVIPAVDLAAWAVSLRELLNDPGRRHAMGHAAAQWAASMPIRACWENFLEIHYQALRARDD